MIRTHKPRAVIVPERGNPDSDIRILTIDLVVDSKLNAISSLLLDHLSSTKILPMKSLNLLEYSFGSTAEIEVGSTCRDLYACSSFLLMS